MFLLGDKAKNACFMIFQEIRQVTWEKMNILCQFYDFIKSVVLFHNHSKKFVQCQLNCPLC